MCGIVGLSLKSPHQNTESVVREMAGRIVHRGPDSGGDLACSQGTAHVGFRRLAIRDLNPRANQPMLSASQRTAIVFNGEVYNSDELAKKYLSDHRLATSGDTEVVLELFERHGEAILPELNGMFAMAIVDMASSKITLVRDRMGKKPLYLYEETSGSNQIVAFASELRSLKPFGLRADARNLCIFFHFGYFTSPYTFYQGTTQVCPGEVVHVQQGRITGRRHYHQFTDYAWGNDSVSLNDLDERFADAIRLRKLSDVPLGSFLSGGVDSALVAAYLADAASSSGEGIPTFTVAFRDQAHDEANDARETANELKLPHRVIEIEEDNLAQLAEDYLDCYEQPYADSSGLVTMLLCRAVKQHVTVALSGDGGDEFFGGYARYQWFQKALLAQKVPRIFRSVAGAGLKRLDRRRGHRLSRWLKARDAAELYCEIKRTWNACDPIDVLSSDVARSGQQVSAQDMVRDVFDRTAGDDLSKAACFDATYYIPDDLQVKLDRASMQVALEVRCPLLDYRVAESGIRLNSADKYADGLKCTLKKLLAKRVSTRILNRPKHGFNVPLARWLAGPMKELVADSLGRRDVHEAGWLDANVLGRIWQDFLAGQSQHALSVWMAFNLTEHMREASANPLFRSLLDHGALRAA